MSKYATKKATKQLQKIFDVLGEFGGVIETDDPTFAYLFGIDLFTNEFVWLNVANNSKSRVAGDTNLSFLTDYFHLTDVMNMYDFFSMMAEKIVEDPMEADVVVTDHEVKCTEGAQIIREYDFEKIRMLMEDAK